MYIDRAQIHVEAGKGGAGAISFRREKYVPKGGPDGGDGGHGGSVIVKAIPGELTLLALKYKTIWKAQAGGRGSGRKLHGADGEDVIINVPVGTLVFDAESNNLVADLDTEDKTFTVAKGGRGGRGNTHFISSTNRAPRIAQPGEPGEIKDLLLEVKTVADVGLVGYPNAGKSTLIKSISAAKPKTAPYPFTTLRPHVGVVEMEDYRRFTVADIPGLIDGASENVGLGHDFLRHIERCRLLCFVLDMAGVDGRDPLTDLDSLRSELAKYDEDLANRPFVIIANKMDLPEATENLDRLKKKEPESIVFPTIAELGEDKEAIITLFQNTLDKLPMEPPEITKKILARYRVPQRVQDDDAAEADEEW